MADNDRQHIDDLRDRMTRAEQNHTNLQQNFRDFKMETQDQFKAIAEKLDELSDSISDIKMVLAKWLGGGTAIMVLVQFAADHLLK